MCLDKYRKKWKNIKVLYLTLFVTSENASRLFSYVEGPTFSLVSNAIRRINGLKQGPFNGNAMRSCAEPKHIRGCGFCVT